MSVLLRKSTGDSGIGTMIFSVVTLFMMIVIMMYSFHQVELTFIRTVLNDGVDIVCLSTVIPDTDAIVEDVKDSIVFDPNNGFSYGGSSDSGDIDFDIAVNEEASYDRFCDLFETNVIEVADNVDVTDIKVESLILYCVNGDDVDEYIYDSSGKYIVISHPDMKGVMDSPTGVNITNTSVYVKFSFTYKDVFGTRHEGLVEENFKAVRIK